MSTSIFILSRLIDAAIKTWNALDTKGFDKADIETIQSFLETGSSVPSMRNAKTAFVAAVHLALVARSFGQAVGRHQEFHGMTRIGGAGRLRRLFDSVTKDRITEIEARVRYAALALESLGNDPRGEIELVDRLRGNPLGTPYYRSLWDAFSNPALEVTDLDGVPIEPPLVMSDTTRREFERYFQIFYLQGLTSTAGGPVVEYLGGLAEYRRVLVRDALVTDLAAWGGRHVFGNVHRGRWTADDAIPFLPLDDLYVEPAGAIEDADGKLAAPEPLLDLVNRLVALDAPRKIVVVTADFGSGKSLSARHLARDWAESFLKDPRVSLDQALPIHVRCSEDFPHEAVDLAGTVRRAWKRLADDIDLSVTDEDDAFAWPDKGQRSVVLLDGLDEVALGQQHLTTLFQKLRDRTTDRHRFIVLSRPGALPPRNDLKDHAVVVKVQPFDADRVSAWLACWNRLPPERPAVDVAAIDSRGLSELVQTPILLFMVAFTWERYGKAAEPPSRAEIYEQFFVQIAKGKADADRVEHGPIARASEALLAELQNRGLLGAMAGLPDAMLWLMGRVAWEAHKLEQRSPPVQLSRRHIENLLQEHDFDLPVETSDAIRLGLILALQADLRSGNHPILFGHQSFREFLVGRHWATHLQRVVRGREKEWDSANKVLMGGRLLAPEDASFDFLMQIVNATADVTRTVSPLTWTERDRETLVEWAQATFDDEFLDRVDALPRMLRNDQRAVMREAALAIGSSTRDSKGLQARDPFALRSLLAWSWLTGVSLRIIAPGFRHPAAMLDDADLDGADFRGANFNGATLLRASLQGADLRAIELEGAILESTNFSQADLRKAELRNASLEDANLFAASLEGSNLCGANLRDTNLLIARLTEARCAGANFYSAELGGSHLERADLEAAHLVGARLEASRLDEANLKGANVARANFRRARLDGASLAEANLAGADFKDALFQHTNLTGATVDAETRWPAGFEPAPSDLVVVAVSDTAHRTQSDTSSGDTSGE